jgi:pimeloyl-ACP methyl ester carboxylesterase
MDQQLFLSTDDGEYIAYRQLNSKLNSELGIIFLGGFMSDMTGTKALALQQFCFEQEINFIRFDYFGHGASSGKFTDGTIGKWRQNVIDVIDRLACPSTILVGSSMGGWLMLLAALARPERVKGLVGIASAPDFTETLIWDMLPETKQKALWENGLITLPSDYCSGSYPITRALIEEGRSHLLLQNPIPLTCPVTLLHGMQDQDVPFQTSIRLAEMLASTQVKVTLLKSSDHRMSEPEQLAMLRESVKEMVGEL